MSEFIITGEQFERACEVVLDQTNLPVTEVIIGGDELSELVRCRDCKHYEDYLGTCLRPSHNFAAEPDGFCAWGERK